MLDYELGRKFLVSACGEYNNIAGNRIFRSISAKRRYIQERLQRKYKRLLAPPSSRT